MRLNFLKKKFQKHKKSYNSENKKYFSTNNVPIHQTKQDQFKYEIRFQKKYSQYPQKCQFMFSN